MGTSRGRVEISPTDGRAPSATPRPVRLTPSCRRARHHYLRSRSHTMRTHSPIRVQLPAEGSDDAGERGGLLPNEDDHHVEAGGEDGAPQRAAEAAGWRGASRGGEEREGERRACEEGQASEWVPACATAAANKHAAEHIWRRDIWRGREHKWSRIHHRPYETGWPM